MTDGELDTLVLRRAKDLARVVLAGLDAGEKIERIVVMWVHKTFVRHDAIRLRVNQNGVRDLDGDGFVFGTRRADARVALLIEDLESVADAIPGDESEAGCALIVLHGTSARIRHIDLEAPYMTKGGSA